MQRTLAMINTNADLFGRVGRAVGELEPDERTPDGVRDAIADAAPEAVDAATTETTGPENTMSDIVFRPSYMQPVTRDAFDSWARGQSASLEQVNEVSRNLARFAQRNAEAHEKMGRAIMALERSRSSDMKRIEDMMRQMTDKLRGSIQGESKTNAAQQATLDEVKRRLLLEGGPASAYGPDQFTNTAAQYKNGENWLTGGIVATDQPAVIPDNAAAGVFDAEYQANGGRLQGTVLCSVWAFVTGPGQLLTEAANINATMLVNNIPIGGMISVPLNTFTQTLVGERQALNLGNVVLPSGVTPVFRLEVAQPLSGTGLNNNVTFYIDAAQNCG